MVNKHPDLTLDSWQRQFLATSGNICLCSPRQMGKSTVVAIHAGNYALNNPNKEIMVISAVERQAYLLFEKILAYIHDKAKSQIKTGKDRPTKSQLKLKNGTIIRCLPTGLTGYGIRGHTIHRLYVDEAAMIPDDVYSAVTPSLATTSGEIILLSTPMGTDNYFYRSYINPDFTTIHVDAEQVLSERPKEQASNMRKFREEERNRLTKREFQQEYEGLFVTELRQFFSDTLIDNVCTEEKRNLTKDKDIYIGIDVGGAGTDDTTYEIIKYFNNNKSIQLDSIIKENTRTTDIVRDVIALDNIYDFEKIGVDDGGIGYGVWCELIENDQTKHKTEALNNSKRLLNFRDQTKKKLLKEEMYNNLRNLMEKGEIKLLDDPNIRHSLKSIQWDETGKKLSGTKSHITEGIIRAAWLITQNKDLNIWVTSIKV